MHFSEIDDLIKRGLQASEDKIDVFATAAKPRVWNAIEKPRKKNGFHLGFALAMAAAFSLFLVSTYLFFRLQHQQEELIALKSSKTPLQSEGNKIVTEKQKASIAEDPGPSTINEKSHVSKEVVQLPSTKDSVAIPEQTFENSPSPESERMLVSEAIAQIPESEIANPDITFDQYKADLDLTSELPESNPPASPNSKPKTKLKFRFGGGSQTHDSGKSLALQIKF